MRLVPMLVRPKEIETLRAERDAARAERDAARADLDSIIRLGNDLRLQRDAARAAVDRIVPAIREFMGGPYTAGIYLALMEALAVCDAEVAKRKVLS